MPKIIVQKKSAMFGFSSPTVVYMDGEEFGLINNKEVLEINTYAGYHDIRIKTNGFLKTSSQEYTIHLADSQSTVQVYVYPSIASYLFLIVTTLLAIKGVHFITEAGTNEAMQSLVFRSMVSSILIILLFNFRKNYFWYFKILYNGNQPV